ncbi:hypothetical protein QDS01_17880 [Acinetobacter nosocomialis]|uniref:hypothetical protein n=1 Tax=Acinetobacter nosocomialis TaxID=106654 RepID=UPI00244897E5|nr:hypothetical protein [Acinetobacter nosocomialis]MDH2636781.1 hypothetical protein [Acinetobacter nosocomialis]
MSLRLTAEDIIKIVLHWFYTQPNGYIGVNYGRNWHEILLKPMTEDSADIILQWMREDIPLFKDLSTSELKIVSRPLGTDQKEFFISVGQIFIPMPSTAELKTFTKGDKFDANAV